MEYIEKGTKFERKYGKTLRELSAELKVSMPTLTNWEKSGFDIFHKAANIIRGNGRLQQTWQNMKSRCGNPQDKHYKYYGGKGVTVKMDKQDLIFLWKRDNAELMKKPSIDRIDSSGHYELHNCRFIELSENVRRRYQGVTRRPFVSYSMSVYFGTGKKGARRVERLENLKKKMGFSSLSELVQHCIDIAYKEKIEDKKGA